MSTDLVQKSSGMFSCETCDYKTCRKSQYIRHIMTPTHKNMIQINTPSTILTTIPSKNTNLFTCPNCNKQYKERTGLWKHKKICAIIEKPTNQDNMLNVILEVVKQNQEFKELMVEQNKTFIDQNNELQNQIIELCKNNNNITNNNVNSHNKTFNLQVFLNEDCKDAMNVTQFIDSFDLQLADFENVGRLGFVNGISDIIIKKLKALDISERPIHCTDQKRHVLYAKVIDKWEKEGDDNKILRKIIKCVAFKNSKNIQLFRDKYPDCMNWDSKHADRYQILRIESLGGLGNEDVDNENKIIRKIAREITVDKY